MPGASSENATDHLLIPQITGHIISKPRMNRSLLCEYFRVTFSLHTDVLLVTVLSLFPKVFQHEETFSVSFAFCVTFDLNLNISQSFVKTGCVWLCGVSRDSWVWVAVWCVFFTHSGHCTPKWLFPMQSHTSVFQQAETHTHTQITGIVIDRTLHHKIIAQLL